MNKGQGSFEYILLLAGILLIVVLAFVLLRGSFPPVDEHTRYANCRALLVGTDCYDSKGDWDSTRIVHLGTVCSGILGGNEGVICNQGGDPNKCTCGDGP
ncbi:MAG: class III signal peptide-containing protein [Candidatus Micrarchaeota archaeon]